MDFRKIRIVLELILKKLGKIYYINCKDFEKNFDKIKDFDKIDIRIIIIINIFWKYDCYKNVLNILVLKILIKVIMFNYYSLDVFLCKL